MSPRKSWLDGRVDVFLDETHRQGLTLPREPVAVSIQQNVLAVAEAMRITETTARRQFTDDAIRELARNTASPFLKEAPGSDPLDLPATHTVSYGLAGRTVAGLAIVAELSTSASAPDPDEMIDAGRQALALVSAWGILIERSSDRAEAVVQVPEALLHRTSRELGKGIVHLQDGVVPVDGGDPDQLGEALANNVADLDAEL